MSIIKPFAAIRPNPDVIAEMIAPPYDVLNRIEAYELARNKPCSFLHITKPEIDLPFAVDEYDPRVYVKGMENLQHLIEKGALFYDKHPNYYLYRLTTSQHQQIGLVAAVALDAYHDNRIHKHELTREEKEQDRMEHILTLNTQVSPVLLTYRQEQSIDQLIESLVSSKADLMALASDHVLHEVWTVADPKIQYQLQLAFNKIDDFYIADGHHRIAAAARVAKVRERTLLNTEGFHQYFLAGIFPDQQLQILGYHRAITDLNDLSTRSFLQRVSEHFSIVPQDEPGLPQQQGQFSLYCDKQWYRLQYKAKHPILGDTVDSLDVSILEANILSPILGINNPRTNKRIQFIGGDRHLTEIQALVDNGEMAAAFILYPVNITDLFAVSDQDKIMPPKSTWFTPKLADGLFSLALV